MDPAQISLLSGHRPNQRNHASAGRHRHDLHPAVILSRPVGNELRHSHIAVKYAGTRVATRLPIRTQTDGNHRRRDAVYF